MASLLKQCLFSCPPVQNPKFTKTLTLNPLISTLKIHNSSQTPKKSYLCIQRISCSNTSDVSPVESDDSSSSSTSSVFIKGLPLPTAEGRLRKAFSEFGEVRQVKIIIDKRTKQSLGYGYVWFTSEKHACLAAEEMNGKFFDGRFISVKLGKPGLSTRQRKGAPYKF